MVQLCHLFASSLVRTTKVLYLFLFVVCFFFSLPSPPVLLLSLNNVLLICCCCLVVLTSLHFSLDAGRHVYMILTFVYDRYWTKRRKKAQDEEKEEEEEERGDIEANREEATRIEQAEENVAVTGEMMKEQAGLGREEEEKIKKKEQEEEDKEKGKHKDGMEDEEAYEGELAKETTIATGEITKEEVRLSQEGEAKASEEEEEEEEKQEGNIRCWHASVADVSHCILFASCFLVLEVLWILLSLFDTSANRYIWISCLFAPFGNTIITIIITTTISVLTLFSQPLCKLTCLGLMHYILFFITIIFKREDTDCTYLLLFLCC